MFEHAVAGWLGGSDGNVNTLCDKAFGELEHGV